MAGFLHYILRQPLGMVVDYLAWNFPLLNFGYKLGPVLAPGCSAIIKPSSLTPLATLAAAELSIKAGLPPGVINVITSTRHAVTNPLLRSPLAALVTMIGSTESGVKIIGESCTTVKHFWVELGGNAPVVVYDDADVAMAAQKTVDLKFANTGQLCVSPNRCFVHARVYEQFLEAAAARADSNSCCIADFQSAHAPIIPRSKAISSMRVLQPAITEKIIDAESQMSPRVDGFVRQK